MNISPPFGYREIVALRRNARVRLLAPGEVPAFARDLNAIPVSFTEFTAAVRDYPIVFTTSDQGQSFSAVAVLGMSAGENLFVDGKAWVKGAYVPAYTRRYPFCMARVKLNAVEQQQRLICVENDHIDENGEALFDADGKPLEKWQATERLLSEYEADLDRCREFAAIVSDYGLLEPFSMQATLKAGGAMHLTGMHRVDEKKLEHLNASQLKNMMRKGVMARIYLHLLSLENFARLLDRKAARGESVARAKDSPAA